MSEKDMRERMAAVLKHYRIRANMTVYEVGDKAFVKFDSDSVHVI